MNYHLETTVRFERQFRKLDHYTQKIINSWILKNLEGCENPRAKGKALMSDRKGQWRYRIGGYRLICLIDDNRLIILAIEIGHRREIYRD